MPPATPSSDRLAHDVRNALMPIRLRLDTLELLQASPALQARIDTLRAHALRLEALAGRVHATVHDCLAVDAAPQAEPHDTQPREVRAIAPAAVTSVLCFDDNALLAESLGMRLELEPGIRWLAPRERLDDAVDVISRELPDVVLLDLGMPGAVRPLDVIAAVRERGLATRVIVLTGASGAAVRQAVLDAGAHGFVSKSVPADRLIAAIRSVAGGGTAVELDP